MPDRVPERLQSDDYMGSAPVRVFRHVLTRPYPLHWHDFYELVFVTDGEGLNIVNGRAYPITRGSASLLTPVDFHEIRLMGGAPLILYDVVFSPKILSAPLHDLLFGGGRVLADLCLPDEAAAFARLYDEQHARLPGFALVLEATVQRLLVMTARAAACGTAPLLITAAPALRTALITLDHHFREPITLSDLARSVHLSPHYFSTLFHEQVGMTFQRYLQTLRLRFAASLLRASDLPITEVCEASGFGSLTHFNRAFKRHYQHAPRAYRQIESNV